jgi:hypothetical protein
MPMKITQGRAAFCGQLPLGPARTRRGAHPTLTAVRGTTDPTDKRDGHHCNWLRANLASNRCGQTTSKCSYSGFSTQRA